MKNITLFLKFQPCAGEIGFDGEYCMNSCPIICGENDIVCKGGVDSNGCKMADTCVYAGTVRISKN